MQLREADQHAAAARAAAVQEVQAAARAEAAGAVARARREARQVRELAGQRTPALVSRAVGLVRDLGPGS